MIAMAVNHLPLAGAKKNLFLLSLMIISLPRVCVSSGI